MAFRRSPFVNKAEQLLLLSGIFTWENLYPAVPFIFALTGRACCSCDVILHELKSMGHKIPCSANFNNIYKNGDDVIPN